MTSSSALPDASAAKPGDAYLGKKGDHAPMNSLSAAAFLRRCGERCNYRQGKGRGLICPHGFGLRGRFATWGKKKERGVNGLGLCMVKSSI